jgi:SAM-dependent methyltransferase
VTGTSIIWHDLECGGYGADLPLWRELAVAHGSRGILDVGAGTGRVTLDLARRGHHVIALERDAELARELTERAHELPVEVVCGDACDFALAVSVSLAIVAMQTVQLLSDRSAFLRCAHGALRGAGTLAIAVLGNDVQPFEVELDADVLELAGIRYASAPTALRQTSDEVVLERRRSAVVGNRESVSIDVTRLARLDPRTLRGEAALAGFVDRGQRRVAATAEHSGSEVLLFEAAVA